MDMDQAAVFLAGSVLTMLGLIVVVIGFVIINNIVHKYWKPIKIFTPDSWQIGPASARFAEPHELDKSNEPKIK